MTNRIKREIASRDDVMLFITWLSPAQQVSFFNRINNDIAIIEQTAGGDWQYRALDGSEYVHPLCSLEDGARMAIIELSEDIFEDFAEGANGDEVLEYWQAFVNSNL